MSDDIYYNEVDPYLCQWLRNLIDAQELPAGTVDCRSVADVDPDQLATYKRVHLFAGIGLWELAARLAQWPDDVRLWTGSCPCQPFSVIGKKKATADARHLWPEMFRLVRNGRPPVVAGEQVAGPHGLRWFAGVQADLEAEGYVTTAVGLNAAMLGAPHQRHRLYWLGYTGGPGLEGLGWNGASGEQSKRLHANPLRPASASSLSAPWLDDGHQPSRLSWYTATTPVEEARHEPGVSPVVDGYSPLLVHSGTRRRQLQAYGNAIVPQLAALFLSEFMKGPLK